MVRRTIVLVLLAAFLAGCAVREPAPKPMAAEAVKGLQKGVTTKEEVLKLFGSPTKITVEKGKENWTYLGEAEARAAGPSPAPSPSQALHKSELTVFTPAVGTPAPATRPRKELTLLFENDILIDYRLRDR